MKLKKKNNFASVYENLKSTSKWKEQSLPIANHNYEEIAIHNWLNDCLIGWFLLGYIYTERLALKVMPSHVLHNFFPSLKLIKQF